MLQSLVQGRISQQSTKRKLNQSYMLSCIFTVPVTQPTVPHILERLPCLFASANSPKHALKNCIEKPLCLCTYMYSTCRIHVQYVFTYIMCKGLLCAFTKPYIESTCTCTWTNCHAVTHCAFPFPTQSVTHGTPSFHIHNIQYCIKACPHNKIQGGAP
jgi:hypothetical protein